MTAQRTGAHDFIGDFLMKLTRPENIVADTQHWAIWQREE